MLQESFWDYSCRVYAYPQVSATCLALQNEHGLDVNLLLFAVWHGRSRGMLDTQTRDAALSFSAKWSDAVVRSLRTARTWLKKQAREMEELSLLEREGILDLREQIKALELHTEHFQQDHLEALSKSPIRALDEAAQRRAASANINAVITEAVTANEALQIRLNTLLTALFEPPPNA